MDTVAETTDLTVPDGTMVTFSYKPTGDQSHPAVIVIQEAFGVNDHIKDVAQRFAAEGYFTTAPDLFHRSGRNKTATMGDMDAAAKLREGMTDDGIVDDLNAVVAHLKSNPSVDGEHIGIVGYCMGGRVSFLAAVKVQGLSAAVVYYGGNILPRPGAPATGPVLLDQAASIPCPILGFFGDQDQAIPPENVRKIEGTLKRLGKDVQIHTYADAGHGFFCDARASYNEAAAKDAWPKTLSFFEKHLTGSAVGAR